MCISRQGKGQPKMDPLSWWLLKKLFCYELLLQQVAFVRWSDELKALAQLKPEREAASY